MHRRGSCNCVPASRRRTALLCAAALLLGGPARSLGASDIEQWCLGATGTFAVADLAAGTIKSRLFYARSCWWLMSLGKTHEQAAEVCAAGHPEQPADVSGRLALVHSRRVYEALVAGLGISATWKPYIGLLYTSGAQSGAPAGWYHEAGPPDARTWRMPVHRYTAPWAEINTVTGSYGVLQGNGLGVYGRPGGIRRYVCQFAHENERPAAYRLVAGGAHAWPAPAVQLGNHTVSPVGGGRVAECGALCATDMLCAGFAVDVRSAHCVTAIDVLDESALEAKHGYQVYERLAV